MSTPGLPDYKKPPKAHVEQARAERDRRKACHGNWYPCSEAHKKVTASTVQEGQTVLYRDQWSEVVSVTDRYANPNTTGLTGGHFATVTLADGRSVRLKPGHFLPMKEA